MLFNAARGLTMQVFQAGPEQVPTVGYNELQGMPVTAPRPIPSSTGHEVVSVRMGDWPTTSSA